MNLTNNNVFSNKVANMHIGIAGISLGFLSISSTLVEYNILWLRYIALVFAIVCLSLLAAKITLFPEKIKDELKDPSLGCVYPTIFMTLMVISSFIAEFNLTIGRILWISATVMHFITFILFAVEMSKDFKLEKMLPSWFIPTVSIGLSAGTSKSMAMPTTAKIFFCYSFTMYLIVFPLMLYRLICKDKIDESKMATLMVIVAPTNVCLSGYFIIAPNPNPVFVGVLSIISYLSLFYGYYILPQLTKLPFSPSLASLTFPLAVNVVACQRLASYLGNIGSSLEILVREFLELQLPIALGVILYIVVQTVIWLVETLFKEEIEMIEEFNLENKLMDDLI